MKKHVVFSSSIQNCLSCRATGLCYYSYPPIFICLSLSRTETYQGLPAYQKLWYRRRPAHRRPLGMIGSIDFMFFPHFDSPTIFAGILDEHNGGKFSIAPFYKRGRHRQMYLPDTNVPLTRFLYLEGVGELSDFMPVQEHEHVHQLV
jgi:hypothetical protein